MSRLAPAPQRRPASPSSPAPIFRHVPPPVPRPQHQRLSGQPLRSTLSAGLLPPRFELFLVASLLAIACHAQVSPRVCPLRGFVECLSVRAAVPGTFLACALGLRVFTVSPDWAFYPLRVTACASPAPIPMNTRPTVAPLHPLGHCLWRPSTARIPAHLPTAYLLERCPGQRPRLRLGRPGPRPPLLRRRLPRHGRGGGCGPCALRDTRPERGQVEIPAVVCSPLCCTSRTTCIIFS